MPAFIIELQDALNESGLEFSTLEPQDPVPNTGYQAIPITISVNGAWQDIVDLMSRLRRITRQVRIVEFTVDPVAPDAEATATASTATELDAQITIEIYTIEPATSQETSAPAAPAAQ